MVLMSLIDVTSIPQTPSDPCPDCGCAEWAWDGTAWQCAICHLDCDAPDLEAERDTWLAWGKAHQFPRLPYGFWIDHHPILGDREIFYLAIVAGETHWCGFMKHADVTTLTLVAAATERFDAQATRKEAA
jgi:hypothetical protein